MGPSRLITRIRPWTAATAERELRDIFLKDRRGTQVVYCEYVYGSNAYAARRFGGNSTRIVLERGYKDWFLVKVERQYVSTQTGKKNRNLQIIVGEPAVRGLMQNILRERGLTVR